LTRKPLLSYTSNPRYITMLKILQRNLYGTMTCMYLATMLIH